MMVRPTNYPISRPGLLNAKARRHYLGNLKHDATAIVDFLYYRLFEQPKFQADPLILNNTKDFGGDAQFRKGFYWWVY